MKHPPKKFVFSDDISLEPDPAAPELWDNRPEKPSKSQRKRDADALQKMGVSLMSLRAADLARVRSAGDTRCHSDV